MSNSLADDMRYFATIIETTNFIKKNLKEEDNRTYLEKDFSEWKLWDANVASQALNLAIQKLGKFNLRNIQFPNEVGQVVQYVMNVDGSQHSVKNAEMELSKATQNLQLYGPKKMSEEASKAVIALRGCLRSLLKFKQFLEFIEKNQTEFSPRKVNEYNNIYKDAIYQLKEYTAYFL